MPPQNRQRLLLRPRNLRFPPAARPPAILMLNQQVRSADLVGFFGGAVRGRGVVRGHVGL